MRVLVELQYPNMVMDVRGFSIVPKAWKMEHARHRYHHPANAGTNRDNAHCPLRQSRPFFSS